MADYYTLQQFAQKLGLAEGEVLKLLTKGTFSPTMKDGRSFYSARQFHQVQAALRLSRRHGTSFEEALQMVFARASRVKQGSVA
jgi:hypothetical protein